ncbi:protein canopy homolog 2-like [Hydractinia symbiolongicarpus]|uniref:protein canopy homolog 2-like n=1 Tax=Hydractinia symbiolongicarpus TaxID=13093 RepID=UPI00254A27D4|nr:protein canopy homolog 2-like [Hydractinia symbiolongicarpus]
MFVGSFVNLIIVVFGTCHSTLASKQKEKMCAACHVVVDEIEYEISKVDPNKVLEIEGFRVDPNGNQKKKKLPYARSEVHLTEITESMCDKMNQYSQSVDKDTGKIKYVLTQSRNGEPLQLENVSMSGEIAEKLRHMCNSIIEENEENIIDYFKMKKENTKKEFCTSVAGLCHSESDKDEEEDDGEEEEEKDEL